MALQDINNDNAPDEEPNTDASQNSPGADVPIGIERIRREWRSAGLATFEEPGKVEGPEPGIPAKQDLASWGRLRFFGAPGLLCCLPVTESIWTRHSLT